MTAKIAKTIKRKPRRPAVRQTRTVRYELRLSERESEMLQELMDDEGVVAAELVRRWLKIAHEKLT